jgi:biotin carboxylase
MRKIAIIGASYLQLPLVEKAKELGVETHCFAWEEGAVCKGIADFFYPISILEKEAILEVCRKVQVDGVISIASDAAVPTISFVADQMGLIGNRYNDAATTTNKYLMREQFARNDIQSPKYRIASESMKIDDFNFPVIVKPTDRSGSRGVQKVNSKSYIDDAITRASAESFSHEVIVEEFVEGVEVSVESISWNGQHHILAITDKVTTGAPYFVELEHHQPSRLPSSILRTIKEQTIKSLDALNVRFGASHAEFKVNDQGEVYIIELGARMGGDFIGSDLVYLSTGYDFLKGVIDISLGHFEEPVYSKALCSGVYFLSKESPRMVNIIKDASNYKEIVKAEITDENLRYVECSADRSGYFIYQANEKFLP